MTLCFVILFSFKNFVFHSPSSHIIYRYIEKVVTLLEELGTTNLPLAQIVAGCNQIIYITLYLCLIVLDAQHAPTNPNDCSTTPITHVHISQTRAVLQQRNPASSSRVCMGCCSSHWLQYYQHEALPVGVLAALNTLGQDLFYLVVGVSARCGTGMDRSWRRLPEAHNLVAALS